MAALRIAALCANACFIAYGLLSELYPVLALHTLLLPCNLLRLGQLRAGRQSGAGHRGEADGTPVSSRAMGDVAAPHREPPPPDVLHAAQIRRAERDWLTV